MVVYIYKTVVVSDSSQADFERKVEKLINGNDVFHTDFKELVSISYDLARNSGFFETIIYSALIVYKTL